MHSLFIIIRLWEKVMQADILIHNGILVTVNNGFDIIENGYLCIKDRIITAVGSADQTSLPEAANRVDAQQGIVMPGLVNTHGHLPMTLFRGLADDLPLMAWLNDHIFPAEATRINADSAKYGALLGCAEMLLSGTTTCCDGYFHEDAVAQAILESGMRGIAGQGVIDFPAPGVPDPAENIGTARTFAEKFLDTSPRLYPSIFCHSPYTCSEKTLTRAKALAREYGLLFQIHVAETKTEADQIRTEKGQSPVGYLGHLGLLDKNTLLVHNVWADAADLDKIQATGAGVSVNTQSNMKLASGIAPLSGLLSRNIPTGLGTDGCASNNDLDLFSEMDMTAKLHKVHEMDPTVASAQTVLTMATRMGAKAIGLDREIGSLEEGKQADLILIDTRKPHLTPMYNPVSHIVYAASGADVRHVWVAGRRVVKDYALRTLDLSEVMDRVRKMVNGEP